METTGDSDMATTHKGKGNGKRKGEPLTAKFAERATEPGKYSDGQRGGHGLMC